MEMEMGGEGKVKAEGNGNENGKGSWGFVFLGYVYADTFNKQDARQPVRQTLNGAFIELINCDSFSIYVRCVFHVLACCFLLLVVVNSRARAFAICDVRTGVPCTHIKIEIEVAGFATNDV